MLRSLRRYDGNTATILDGIFYVYYTVALMLVLHLLSSLVAQLLNLLSTNATTVHL